MFHPPAPYSTSCHISSYGRTPRSDRGSLNQPNMDVSGKRPEHTRQIKAVSDQFIRESDPLQSFSLTVLYSHQSMPSIFHPTVSP